jgi:hypothetical protein
VVTGAGLSLGASLVTGATAHAADYEVDRNDDTVVTTCDNGAANDCTLRGAIQNANGSAGVTDVIYFDSTVTGTITLGGTELSVTGETYIYGPGADNLTISANGASRVFHLNMGTSGDVFYLGDLTLTGGTVVGDGGAIHNVDASLRVIDSVLTGNSATGANGDGGAIYNSGIFADGYANVVAYSTINNNDAGKNGGGVYGFESAGAFYSSTVSGNTAGVSNVAGVGGGIYLFDESLVADTTVFGNNAPFGGGIVEVGNDPTAVLLDNSIVGGNTATTGPDIAGRAEAAFSLIQSTAGTALVSQVANSNITGVAPLLGILQDNGGPTPTHLPGTNSPFVDCGSSPAPDDQRALDRVVDQPGRANSTVAGANGADMGSVELEAGAGSTGACANLAPPPGTTPVTPPPAKKKKKKCKKKLAPGKKKKCKKKKKKRGAASASPPWRRD